MPVDYAEPPALALSDEQEFPDDFRLYRSFLFGTHLELVLTDLRRYRPDHLVPEDAFPGAVFMDEASAKKTPAKAGSNQTKPNILVLWGDDIGIANLSCYTHGLMGYHTPNIDRIANEGMRFTDSYGEQSCTAGRSSFITGQSCYRT